MAVDLWTPAGRALLRRLVQSSDVLVENFRPGVLAALGLDDEWLGAEAPNVVVASISGFGHVGPLSDDACFDQVAQGMSGFMSLTGTAESGPVRAGIPIADLVSGVFAALGICAALAGGEGGRRVQTSLLESMMALLVFQGQRQVSLGETPGVAGNDHPVVSPYGVFPTADLPINVAAATPGQWGKLCEIIERPHLVDDPRFRDPAGRDANRMALRRELEGVLRTRTAAEWLARFRDASVPAGPVHDLAGAFDDPQVVALRMVENALHPTLGVVPVVRGPVWFDGEPLHVRQSSPMHGEHSRQVLLECGLTEAEVAVLIETGAVREWEGLQQR